MKRSTANETYVNAAKYQGCSEKKCITCFENRGCMYEQYLVGTIQNPGEPYSAKNKDQVIPIWKQGIINFDNHPSQKIPIA